MSKRKLLLADDSVTIQKVVNLTFADEGIEVISVGDGDSAMQKVAEISPDLIMADVNMPGLTGYEICERIRQDEKLGQTPVILLVGSFEPFDEDEARRVGADDYLTKPFQSIRQLVNKVTVLLNSTNGENSEDKAIANSLEDTLEMDAEELAINTQPSQYADTSFDDEMIQTNRPANFAFDESQKFESRHSDALETTSQYETLEKVQESVEEPLDENDSVSYQVEENVENTSAETDIQELEINENESFSPEIEGQNATFELETSNGESYPVTEQNYYGTESPSDQPVSEDITPTKESIEYEIKEDVTEEVEESLEIYNDEVTNDPITDELLEQETILESTDDYSNSSITYDVSDSETADQAETISEEIKDYQFVSEETPFTEVSEPIETETVEEVQKEEVEENLPDEIESTELESEETVDAGSVESESEEIQKTQEEDIPLPEFASVLELDDDDILQLPPIENEEEEEVVQKVEPASQNGIIITPAAVATSLPPQTEIHTTNNSPEITPELIELIVNKVIERLSENAVKEVAWEVVPQMTELIVKKMAEEKLKD